MAGRPQCRGPLSDVWRLFTLIITALATSSSSISVIANALRLRGAILSARRDVDELWCSEVEHSLYVNDLREATATFFFSSIVCNMMVNVTV